MSEAALRMQPVDTGCYASLLQPYTGAVTPEEWLALQTLQSRWEGLTTLPSRLSLSVSIYLSLTHSLK